MNKVIILVVLLALFAATAYAAGASPGSVFAQGETDRTGPGVVLDFEATEDEEVVMEYVEAQEEASALGSRKFTKAISLPELQMPSMEVPQGGFILVRNMYCELDCAAFYNNTETSPVCVTCTRYVRYDKPANRGCYAHPDDFKNGVVSQDMVNIIHTQCRNVCVKCTPAAPKVTLVGLFKAFIGKNYFGSQALPVAPVPVDHESQMRSSGFGSVGGMLISGKNTNPGSGSMFGGHIGGSVVTTPIRPSSPVGPGPNPLGDAGRGFGGMVKLEEEQETK